MCRYWANAGRTREVSLGVTAQRMYDRGATASKLVPTFGDGVVEGGHLEHAALAVVVDPAGCSGRPPFVASSVCM